MANELSEQKSGALITAIDQQGIGEMLKPLIREIHLFDSFVSGTALLADQTVLGEIRPGDQLTLMREESKFDDHAILILTGSGRKLGYIPEKDTVIFARLMDAGKRLTAKISKIDRKGSFTLISIGIYLVDF